MTFDPRHLRQPSPATCGQTCIAMIRGVPVEDVIADLGNRKTWPSDLRLHLSRYGWAMSKRPAGKLPYCPQEPALVFLRGVVNHKLTVHWTLWTGKVFLDPASDSPRIQYGNNWSGTIYPIAGGEDDGS